MPTGRQSLHAEDLDRVYLGPDDVLCGPSQLPVPERALPRAGGAAAGKGGHKTPCMLTCVHLPCDMGVMAPGRLW